MPPSTPSRTKRQRGQALVETALTLFWSLLLLLGVLDAGLYAMQAQWNAHRARATARWATTHAASDAQIKNWAAYGTAAGRTGPGMMWVSPENVTVDTTNPTRIVVRIATQVKFFSPYLRCVNTPTAVAVTPVESRGSNGNL